MSTTSPPPPSQNNLQTIAICEALESRYLAYALSTIMHRALPDVRDGLKPVHRRLLYVMQQLRLDPNTAFKKCAKVVGDVIGSYHPHGDIAIYDALVRLAQDFSLRYPLIDGQGNFGNIDGDNAAAYRYTEARMTEVAKALLAGLDEDTVDFRPNYDGSLEEPIVLPAAFPNLLANGASGIAVGMATSIPPHNVAELCDAALYLISTPNASAEKLLKFVPGPDFPTGGILVEKEADILAAYKSGKGFFRIRARWHREELARGAWQIIVTEIPYQVQKSRLIEKIAELLFAKKLTLLGDVRDESAEDIRLVLEPKSRTSDPTFIMEQLFKNTELETRFPLNMNVLSKGRVPMVMSLAQALREWLDHRKEILIRRTNFQLEKIARRLELIEGYIIAYLNLDEVIAIIREEDEPKPPLMARFNLTDAQAEAILNMRLRSLRKLEEMELRHEHHELGQLQKTMQGLLASEQEQWDKIAGELKDIKEKYGKKTPLGRRRTDLAEMPIIKEDFAQSLVEKEPITIICSERGWIRGLKGHIEDHTSLSYKDGDAPAFALKAETTDKIMLFSSLGKFFTLDPTKLPGGRGHGEPLRLIADLEADEKPIALFLYKAETRLLLVSSAGDGFLITAPEALATTRKGKQVLNVKAPATAFACMEVPDGADHLAVIGENRKMVIFPLNELPHMPRGKGVRLQKYKQGGLSDLCCFKLSEGLSWQDSAKRRFNIHELREWLGSRAQSGRLPPKGFPKNNKFTG